MKTSRLAPDRCPDCSHPVDATTSIDGDNKPSPGDFTVCMYCGGIFSFNDDLKMASLTEDETDWLKEHITTYIQLLVVQRAVGKMRRQS